MIWVARVAAAALAGAYAGVAGWWAFGQTAGLSATLGVGALAGAVWARNRQTDLARYTRRRAAGRGRRRLFAPVGAHRRPRGW